MLINLELVSKPEVEDERFTFSSISILQLIFITLNFIKIQRIEFL